MFPRIRLWQLANGAPDHRCSTVSQWTLWIHGIYWDSGGMYLNLKTRGNKFELLTDIYVISVATVNF